MLESALLLSAVELVDVALAKTPRLVPPSGKGATISRSLVSFSANMRGLIPALWRERRVWYPRSTHTAFVTWAFFGRWGPNRRSWQKTGTKSPQFADLGAKKALGDTKPRDSARSPGRAGTKPRDSARGSHLKGAKPRDSVCGVASRGGKPAISTFGPAPRQVCGKCDGWPLVEKVLEAVAPHPYNASLRLCAQRWIHPGAWQDGVAA